jgi:ABC-type transporter Mla subunit MlaD
MKRNSVGLAPLMIGLAMLAGCSLIAPNTAAVSYNTELDTIGGLGAGSPVIYAGKPIGSVTSIGWKFNGDSKVNFEVQDQYASDVHQDSIMVLHADTMPPALDLYNSNPSSPAAAPGSKIDGASSQRELAAIIAAHGVSALTSSLVGVTGALSSVPSAPGSPSAAPPAVTIDQLQKELAAVQAQANANGSANTAATAAQLQSLNQQIQSLQQALIKQGSSPQAQQLRDEINQLARTLATPMTPPSASAGTPVTPPVH